MFILGQAIPVYAYECEDKNYITVVEADTWKNNIRSSDAWGKGSIKASNPMAAKPQAYARTENASHKLTVFLISGANTHAGNLMDNLTNNYSIALDYLLLFENHTSVLESNCKYENIKTLKSDPYQGLLFNLDYSKGKNNKLPPKEITVKSGEKIKVAYRIGGYEDTENYAFVVMIDWKAVRIDNQFYKLVKTEKGRIGYGEVYLQMPLNQGKYEVTGWVIPNPFDKNKLNLFPLDSSYRFTLNVV